jgi:hypothetical protein
MGSAVTVEGWAVRVNSVTPDATAAVLAENQFNDPPAAGNQFFIVNVSMTYTATSPSSDNALGVTLDLGVIGSGNVVYQDFRQYCGVIPDELPASTTVFTGGTIQGNICWQVPSAEVGSLLLVHDELGVFWNLR